MNHIYIINSILDLGLTFSLYWHSICFGVHVLPCELRDDVTVGHVMPVEVAELTVLLLASVSKALAFIQKR